MFSNANAPLATNLAPSILPAPNVDPLGAAAPNIGGQASPAQSGQALTAAPLGANADPTAGLSPTITPLNGLGAQPMGPRFGMGPGAAAPTQAGGSLGSWGG